MPTPKKADTHIEPCLNLCLRRSDRIISQIYNHHLAECGLTSGQFAILRAVKLFDNCSSQDIQEVLVIDQTTLSRNLKRLIAEGYIRTEECQDDRRRKLLSLSKEGARLFKIGEKHWQVAQSELKSQLGPKLSQQILNLSDSIMSKCGRI